ncbi:LLM class oxidoreductase [Pedobacter antarcticus]|uniref:LLM class oxidoreductase n=1 Tax=Pedobacter antarcticus TaxID=34086 RepID=UPI0029307904|nr:LLM class oxidoreductase [Pedobacter antarcticus]
MNTLNLREEKSPNGFKDHKGYSRIFQKGKLTFGFIAPIENYPHGPLPTMENHEKMIRRADLAGISALWLRDVPFLDPNFGDAGQIFDPLVYAGWLAGITKELTIGTAGVVLPLRDPLIVAKQAASIDQLLKGRFILGLASGDRRSEYPAFGVNFENRASRYRDALNIITQVTENTYPTYRSDYYGQLEGDIDLVPKPFHKRLTKIAIGRSGQNIEWIAEHMDGWIWHGIDARRMADIVPQWNAANKGIYKPYGYATWFELSKDPDEPLQPGRILKAGRNTLIKFWKEQETAGISHVALNLKPSQRSAEETLDELAEYVLPFFPSH